MLLPGGALLVINGVISYNPYKQGEKSPVTRLFFNFYVIYRGPIYHLTYSNYNDRLCRAHLVRLNPTLEGWIPPGKVESHLGRLNPTLEGWIPPWKVESHSILRLDWLDFCHSYLTVYAPRVGEGGAWRGAHGRHFEDIGCEQWTKMAPGCLGYVGDEKLPSYVGITK